MPSTSAHWHSLRNGDVRWKSSGSWIERLGFVGCTVAAETSRLLLDASRQSAIGMIAHADGRPRAHDGELCPGALRARPGFSFEPSADQVGHLAVHDREMDARATELAPSLKFA
jgi:hypothetical protein